MISLGLKLTQSQSKGPFIFETLYCENEMIF